MLQESVQTSKRAANAAQGSSSANLEELRAQVQDLQQQRAEDAHAASARSVLPGHCMPRVHAWLSGQLQVQPCSARCITERLQAASTLDQPALQPLYLTADSGSSCPSMVALRESLAARPQITCLLCRVADVQTELTKARQSAPSEDRMLEAASAPGKLHQDLQDATHQVRACLGYGACVEVHCSKCEGAKNDRCCTADCRAEAAAGCLANSGQAGQQRPRSHAAE